jgi:hypothetical protein
VHLVDVTGASVTNKGELLWGVFSYARTYTVSGVFYEAGKEAPPEGPPKLHLLIESNDEFRVCCSFLPRAIPTNRLLRRSSKQCAKSSDCLLRLLLQPCRLSPAALRLLKAATASFEVLSLQSLSSVSSLCTRLVYRLYYTHVRYTRCMHRSTSRALELNVCCHFVMCLPGTSTFEVV